MGDPDAPPLQAGALFELLSRQNVRFIVVGGLAATIYGAVRVTFDIDLVPQWTDENLEALAGALREAGGLLRAPGADAPLTFPIDSAALGQFEVSMWRTELGDLDVIAGLPTATRGVLAGFDDLLPRAHTRHVFGLAILVADLDDVISSKQALGRDVDLAALPELHRLRDRQPADGSSG